MRLAFARINQETNALSPVLTHLADFKAVHYFDDDTEIMRRCSFWPMEVDSMFRNAELSGFVQHAQKAKDIELVPLLSAWAVPSGPLSRACFDALVDRLLEKLRAAGEVDGVYLSLHGAMNVEDLPLLPSETPESEIVRRVREVVGDVLPVVVSLDLHGNVGRGLVERCTFIQGYQTNPHRDHKKVGARCARVLIDTVRGAIAPKMTWRSLPMMLGGGNTVDFLKPLRPVFQRMKAMEKDARVLGTTLMTVHPWNRHPELGWSVLVAVDGKRDAMSLAEAHADELANMAWGVRHQLPPSMKRPEEAIARARKRTLLRKTGVVVISDASDVVSAGAPGENTALVKALVEATDLKSYSTIRDPALVDTLFKERTQVGDVVDVTLGKKLDRTRGAELHLSATIERMASAHGLGRHVVLRKDNAAIVVVEGPALAVKPGYYKDAGLDPFSADVVMVKNFFPFLLFFAPIMRDVIFVRTAGVSDFDAAFALDFTDPLHPRDKVDDWHHTDHRRRALPVASKGQAPYVAAAA